MGQELSTFTEDLGPVISVAKDIINLIEPLIKQLINPNPVFMEVKRHAEEDNNGRMADEADADVGRGWRDRVRPDHWPTMAEYERAEKMVADPPGRPLFHFGIAGAVNSGKSSLLNSFRRLGPLDEGAAGVDIVERTSTVSRYNDPRPEMPFAYYDIPGSGTFSHPDASYFNSQCLFALDCILVLVNGGGSFEERDAGLIKQCRRFSIPVYVVCSQSDVQIEKIIKVMGEDKGNEAVLTNAREDYIDKTTKNIKRGLADSCLPDQRAYLVNFLSMLRLCKEGKADEFFIHERELLEDIVVECKKRRLPQDSGLCLTNDQEN